MSAGSLLKVVGSRVRWLREQRGLSRRALAERSRLSERFLAQIELGVGNPSIASLLQISDALQTTCSSLLEMQQMRRAISLLGLRGAGKSSVGKAAAEKLGFGFVELDQKIEEAAGFALQEIFVLHGEKYYRDLELDAVRRLFPRDVGMNAAASAGIVIAASGGIVTSRESFELLKKETATVWLRAEPEDHWNRVVEQGDHRPMGNDPLAMERMRNLLKERESLYAEANVTIDTSGKTVAAVADEVVKHVTEIGILNVR
ncbi:MAG: shikimate kinase [Planctomycetota bacterium]